MQRFHRVMGKSLYVDDTARKSKIANPKSEMESAGSRIRTDDLLITNQLLYQLSYAGKNAAHINARRRLEQVAKLRSVNAS